MKEIHSRYSAHVALGLLDGRFLAIGVGHRLRGSNNRDDPLAGNKDTCLRDAALMQRLGINAIHIHNVDPSANHDDCASIFNAAGIYMVVDVDPNGSLNGT
ncbi:hypothetical protein VTN49DRAFT_3803 [Thermomyces lanuginosus]|uniref:uncharacterized protein n=1 Tax=Thermomyces lanuginosus TaxID=5541 RepID=UPI0037430F65